MGIQAQPLLGDTDSTHRISFMKGLRTPLPCCLQSLVISEEHHKRGTLMQLNPKNVKIHGKKGQHSQPEKTFSFRNKRSVLGLLCPAFTGQRNLEFPTLEYCTWQTASSYPTELQNCHFPDPGVHSQQLRAPSVIIHRFHLPTESQVRSQEQHRWGGEAPLLGQSPSEGRGSCFGGLGSAGSGIFA